MLRMAIDMNVYLKLFCLILDLKPCLRYLKELSLCDSSFEYSHHDDVLGEICYVQHFYLSEAYVKLWNLFFFINHIFCYYLSLTDI